MDIDLDLQTSFNPLDYFDAVVASMEQNSVLKKHPAGIYFQDIPKDNISGLSAIPYKEAEELGYVKFDLLHLSILDMFEDKEEIRILIKQEPDWSLLEVEENVEKLFQIHNNFKIIQAIKPKSVIDLADCLALIRPGKRKFLKAYLVNKDAVRAVLYMKNNSDSYIFKKGHAIAYALTIVLQLHLIKAGLL